jgi:hypothetical protein
VSIKLIFLVLVAIVATVYAGVSIWADYRLESRLEKLRAAGEPTCIADLDLANRKGTNGADVLFGVRPAIEAFAKEHGQFYKTDLGKAYQEMEGGELPTKEQAAAMRAILDKYPSIEPALREALKCDYYRSRLDYKAEFNPFLESLLNGIQDARTYERMLRWQGEVLLAEGKISKAVEAGVLALRLSRMQEEDPALVSGLVAVANRLNAIYLLNQALRTGPISAEKHAELDHTLARFDDLNWYVKVLKTERAVNLSAARDLFPHFPVTWMGTLFQADLLDLYDHLLPLADQPAYLSAKNIAALEPDSDGKWAWNVLLKLFFPAIQAANNAANRNLAEVRCLRVLNALQVYEQSHGKEATGLDDLDLPAAATIDPFDGKPLKLKKTDAGWVIYSVYQNGKGDGGKFAEMEDCGLAPPGYKE